LLLLFVLFSALSLQSSVAAALHRLVKLFFFFLVVIVEPNATKSELLLKQ